MALSVTSAPHQQIAMPALDLRRYLGVGLQEGVRAEGDMAVAQRAAGANMSVDIAAGEALVQGDTVANQGRYYVLNDAVFNLTGFSAAHATLPRIDRVTLRVRDAFHGDADNTLSFQIVTGTATAGATLVNLTGAAAVPASQLLLANVLVPATATTITTANIDTTVRVRLAPSVPTARVFHNANQSITNATATALAFNSERYDTDAIHDTVTNNTRLTCKTAGKYLVHGHVGWANSAAGTYRRTNIRLNGATVIAFTSMTGAAGFGSEQSVSTVYDLAVNDYVELVCDQDSGGALNVIVAGNYSPEFGMARLG